MNFAEAMAKLLNGHRMRRREWGRALYVQQRVIIVDNTYADCMVITMNDGKTNAYTPAQCDMSGNDWEQVL